VLKAGGLMVIGTERHEARRIDNQLRGRSGRQGDPGESMFYLSLEDDLMRRFGGERVKNLMKTLRMPEDEPIYHNLITKSIQQAQVRVEGYNFDIRKRVVQYDDVVNKQRTVIYKQRRQILESSTLRSQIEQMVSEAIHELVEEHTPEPQDQEDWHPDELYRAALALYPVPSRIKPDAWKDLDDDEIALDLTKGAVEAYDVVEKRVSPEIMRLAEREVMLRTIDQYWVRHLTDLDMLREGIGLVAYAQRDPLVEYKREAFQMWEDMQDEIKQQVVRFIYRVEVAPQAQAQLRQMQQQSQPQASLAQPAASPPPGKLSSPRTSTPAGQAVGNGEAIAGAVKPKAPLAAGAGTPAAPLVKGMMGNVRNVRTGFGSSSAYAPPGEDLPTPSAAANGPAEPARGDAFSRAGRNDPCPCGSGKKFKNCHYKIIQEQRNTQRR
jgi:preprotein translocase subunit SecA